MTWHLEAFSGIAGWAGSLTTWVCYFPSSPTGHQVSPLATWDTQDSANSQGWQYSDRPVHLGVKLKVLILFWGISARRNHCGPKRVILSKMGYYDTILAKVWDQRKGPCHDWNQPFQTKLFLLAETTKTSIQCISDVRPESGPEKIGLTSDMALQTMLLWRGRKDRRTTLAAAWHEWL